jgi:MFS family permease
VTRKLLGNHSLLILGFAESVSGIGNWITMLAVFSIVVFRGGGNAMQSSAVFLAGLVPTLLFSPVSGWLADRFDRKWLMVGSEVVSGLAVAGLIFVDRLEFVYALLVLQAISYSIMTPARQAIVAGLVPSHDLTQANAFLQQLAGLVKIGGPMLAGLLLAIVEPQTAILLDVVSFALSAAILTRLPSLPPARQQATGADELVSEPTTPPGQTALSALWGSSRLRLLFMLTFSTIVVIIGFDVLAPIFTREVLQGDEGLFGLLIGLIGLGTVGAAMALMVRKGDSRPWRDLVLGLFLVACLPACLAVATWSEAQAASQILAGVGCLLGGVGNGLLVVQAGTLLQLLSPPGLLGRNAGMFQSVLVAGQMIGLLATPLLVPALLPMSAFFFVSALAMAGLGMGALLATQRMRSQSQVVVNMAPASAAPRESEAA